MSIPGILFPGHLWRKGRAFREQQFCCLTSISQRPLRQLQQCGYGQMRSTAPYTPPAVTPQHTHPPLQLLLLRHRPTSVASHPCPTRVIPVPASSSAKVGIAELPLHPSMGSCCTRGYSDTNSNTTARFLSRRGCTSSSS